MVDICKGNYEKSAPLFLLEEFFAQIEEDSQRLKGDFGMSKKPTNPLDYLATVGINSIFRFILTHADMDHLDGLDVLMSKIPVNVFWETGVRRNKPSFDGPCPYKEEDWDRYQKIVERKQDGITVLSHLAGSRFQFANRGTEANTGGDGLYILAPDSELVKAATQNGDVNDGSYVLLYRTGSHKIIIPGDAHDETWKYVIEHHKEDVANCSVLFAPHHGRKSGRDFSFLDVLKPKVTFFGCAESGNLAYNSWYYRGLRVITNNQAGNIVMDCSPEQIDLYVENVAYAESLGRDLNITNAQGYVFIDAIN